MPVVATKQTLWEVADVIEQIYTIALTVNLYPRPEDYDAATCDYAADHGLSSSAMVLHLRQSGTTSTNAHRSSP